MLDGGYDATDEICDRSVLCVHAVDSPQMLVMRFDTQEQAAMVAKRYGKDGDHSFWIAVYFKLGGLPLNERKAFMRVLSCID